MANRRIANELIARYNIPAQQGHYRETGNWYHHLRRFPGVFFDKNGYILFETEETYRNCPYLELGKQVGVSPRRLGISAIPEYVPYPDGAEILAR